MRKNKRKNNIKNNTNNNKIKGNIETLYLIPFICNCNEINKASKFIEHNTNIKVKIPNFTKKINLLIEKRYLLLKNKPHKTKYCKKIIEINKDLIIEEILSEIKSVTNNFTYQFKINGKNIIKKKRFSYNNECYELKEKLKIKSNKNKLFNLFKTFIKIILINKAKKEKINRKTKYFSYNELINQFIESFSLNKKILEEYNDYIDNENIIIIDYKKYFYRDDNFIKFFKKICKNYKLIKNINENSFYLGLILK